MLEIFRKIKLQFMAYFLEGHLLCDKFTMEGHLLCDKRTMEGHLLRDACRQFDTALQRGDF